MTQDLPAFDWQHSDVIAATAGRLMKRIEGWRREKRRDARYDQRDQQDVIQAILWAGAQLDGYVMARFLEDTSRWPSDSALVSHLQTGGIYRDLEIKRLQENLLPKSDKNQELQIGFRFVGMDGRVYEITDFTGPELCIVTDIQIRTYSGAVPRTAILDRLRTIPQDKARQS